MTLDQREIARLVDEAQAARHIYFRDGTASSHESWMASEYVLAKAVMDRPERVRTQGHGREAK